MLRINYHFVRCYDVIIKKGRIRSSQPHDHDQLINTFSFEANSACIRVDQLHNYITIVYVRPVFIRIPDIADLSITDEALDSTESSGLVDEDEEIDGRSIFVLNTLDTRFFANDDFTVRASKPVVYPLLGVPILMLFII